MQEEAREVLAPITFAITTTTIFATTFLSSMLVGFNSSRAAGS